MKIDLSVPINSKTPVYPGDPQLRIKSAGQISEDGFNYHVVTIGTHVGTHIDAPSHMLEDGKTLDQIPLEQFFGRGVVISVKNKKFELKDVKSANIQANDIVFFYTGMIDQYHDAKEYFENYPQIPEDIARYLIDKKVKMIGVDMCSPDHPDFPIHRLLLKNDVLIIENLINLDQLIGKEFEVIALPLNLQIDASPARVVATIKLREEIS